jgi:hypothetical protein
VLRSQIASALVGTQRVSQRSRNVRRRAAAARLGRDRVATRIGVNDSMKGAAKRNSGPHNGRLRRRRRRCRHLDKVTKVTKSYKLPKLQVTNYKKLQSYNLQKLQKVTKVTTYKSYKSYKLR